MEPAIKIKTEFQERPSLRVVETPTSAEGGPAAAPAKKTCARCLYDEETPAIVFDQDGVCNYCRMHDQLDREYPAGAEGRAILERQAEQIRREGKGKDYDCVVGVSGGCDSSYLVWLAKDLGLRPLAAHFDNTWDSKTAVENIHNVLDKLGVDLYTHVVDNVEYNDIYRSFLKAGVPDIEAPTDIGLASTLYMAAAKAKVRWIFEGHSFRSEGVSPLGWLYMDGKYISTIQKTYGGMPIRTFPNLTMARFLWWTGGRRIKKIRPLYHLEYRKEEVKKFLVDQFGWQWYGGHHLENRFTAFYHSYFLPRRFGIDQRVNGYSALMRSGQMTREEGMRLMAQPPHMEAGLLEMVRKRLGLDEMEFERLMNLPRRTFKEFRTYKKDFERLRPLFWAMYKLDLVPKSFYLKYTSRKNI